MHRINYNDRETEVKLKMRVRVFVLYIYLIGFAILMVATVYRPIEPWLQMEWWQIALEIYPLASDFGAVLIAYWVFMDESEIESLRKEMEQLKEK